MGKRATMRLRMVSPACHSPMKSVAVVTNDRWTGVPRFDGATAT